MEERVLHEARFRALGSDCRVVSDLSAASVQNAIHRLEDLEARWSRFRPDSEITQANLASGRWVEVSAITHELIDRARLAHERTDGIIDARIGKRLVELGYDRSHDTLELSSEPINPIEHVDDDPDRTWDVGVDGSSIKIPLGVAFDPGGLGKGLAADTVMDDLLGAGAEWALVALGGDLRFGGTFLEEHGWQLQIENPLEPGQVWGTQAIRSGAVCTSSTRLRRWRSADGAVHHHLIDPRTGCPAETPVAAATVAAADCWWADVVAKVAVLDPDMAAARAVEWQVEILRFDHDGTVTPIEWRSS